MCTLASILEGGAFPICLCTCVDVCVVSVLMCMHISGRQGSERLCIHVHACALTYDFLTQVCWLLS